jgi:hypothetical protein
MEDQEAVNTREKRIKKWVPCDFFSNPRNLALSKTSQRFIHEKGSSRILIIHRNLGWLGSGVRQHLSLPAAAECDAMVVSQSGQPKNVLLVPPE